MKKHLKKLLWIVGIIIVIIVIGASVFAMQKKGPQYTTVQVGTADITQVVEATGSVASAEDLSLAFKTTGRVQDIKTKLGAEVKRGDQLARVVDLALTSQVDRARAAVVSAQSDLDRLLAGTSSEDAAVSQARLDQTKITLNKAKVDLANATAKRVEYRDIYIDTALQSLDDALFVAAYSLDIIFDGILDNEAKTNFVPQDSSVINQASALYTQINGQVLPTATAAAKTAAISGSRTDVLTALNSARDALNDTLKLVDIAFTSTIDAFPQGTYTQTVIDGWKTTFNTRATALSTEKGYLQSSINDLTVSWQDLDTAYDNAVAAVQSAEQAMAVAEAEYAALVADPRDYEIRQLEARLSQANADLLAAQSNWSDTVITAPVDGLITKIDIEVGELAGPSLAAIKMIGDNTLQINVDIPEADISKVAVGQTVDITLDAFGLDRKFTGTVSFVEPSERLIQDVVYYRIVVAFNEEDPEIKPGMTAAISIITSAQQGIIALPLRAVIIDKDGLKTVRVLENGNVVIRPVTTGIRSEDGTIEIISGLKQGETVITGEVTS